ncbi:MAG: type II 3-dehydroquinate dehydratase [Crocinitomicaceae bacterium TMED16]|nr:type II 3-dehydroquinate dehydratase [Crocinitomicaceae bacterium]OUT68908.1 MAG: type II 3-dehydroquinate dehydratase [Crocinitomicaceae bacterium TMED16]|tara:strand:- start:849 stop:1259 length:411 start_codon:yes stop_codon:yes gene_type:complete
MKLAIINGPNLNLLGSREPSIYGAESFNDFFDRLCGQFDAELTYFQSNIEGELINELQRSGFDGFILNAGGYTHTSVALRDCIAAISAPVVEVHISNIHARETFRHESLLAPVCVGSIVGLGIDGYSLAVRFFLNK